jgi:hypothetical protein
LGLIRYFWRWLACRRRRSPEPAPRLGDLFGVVAPEGRLDLGGHTLSQLKSA